MPVILPAAAYDRWLSCVEPHPRDLLVPYDADLMAIWPISTRVNAVANDDADCWRRLTNEQQRRVIVHGDLAFASSIEGISKRVTRCVLDLL